MRPLQTFLLTEVGTELSDALFGRRRVLGEFLLTSNRSDEDFIGHLNTVLSPEQRFSALTQYIMMLSADILIREEEFQIVIHYNEHDGTVITLPANRNWINPMFEIRHLDLHVKEIPELEYFVAFLDTTKTLMTKYKRYRLEKFMQGLENEKWPRMMDIMYNAEKPILNELQVVSI